MQPESLSFLLRPRDAPERARCESMLRWLKFVVTLAFLVPACAEVTLSSDRRGCLKDGHESSGHYSGGLGRLMTGSTVCQGVPICDPALRRDPATAATSALFNFARDLGEAEAGGLGRLTTERALRASASYICSPALRALLSDRGLLETVQICTVLNGRERTQITRLLHEG